MVSPNRGSHPFKLGVLAGMMLFLAIDCFVGLFTLQDYKIMRFFLMLIFAAAGVGCTLHAYRKI